MFYKVKFITILALLYFSYTFGCTGIVQKAENGNIVYARTLEFGADLVSFDLLYFPRDYVSKSDTPSGKPGLQWKVKYAHVGFSPFNLPLLADGINEKGLACGAFYFPDWAEYQKVTPEESEKTLSNLYLVSWILANFSTAKEVKSALDQIKVAGVVFKDWGFVAPLHYIVVDESGDRLVIEYIKGELKLYDAKVGVITNSPNYDWHTTNLLNYISLNSLNIPSLKIDGQHISGFGQGTGGFGLPGDFTPPSRFVRATFFNQFALPGKTGLQQVYKSFKILNQFDIPIGSVKAVENGKTIYEETQWTAASDLANRRYFFHTATDRVLRSIDLNKLDPQSKNLKKLKINFAESVIDMTNDLN